MDVLTFILTVMSDSGVTFEMEDRSFVYSVARRIVGNAADAEDVAQEALLLAYRNRDAFRGDSRYRTWLYRIAVTTALGFLRRGRRARLALVSSTGSERVLEQRADPTSSPRELLEQAEDRATVERAIVELAPPYRDVLVARADATEEEVAKTLGITVANVKVRAHRARKQLRAVIERIEQQAA